MFKRRIHDKLDKIYAALLIEAKMTEGKTSLIELLKEENKELREQVKSLMDRFMARDFEQLRLYSNESVEVHNFKDLNPFSDEDISGMVIGDEVKDEAQ